MSVLKTGTRLLTGLTDAGVVYTDDEGATWDLATAPYTGWPYALAVDPEDPDRLYCGTYSGSASAGSFMVSTDQGANWAASTTGLPLLRCLCLDVDPRVSGAAGILHLGHGSGGLYRSADGGATWATVTGIATGLSIYGIARHPVTPDTLICCASGLPAAGGGIYQSTDNGLNWSVITAAVTKFIAPLCLTYSADGSAILVGAYRSYSGGTYSGGLWRSTDGGLNYTRTLDQFRVRNLFRGIDGAIYLTSSNPGATDISPGTGLWWSTDGGLKWRYYAGLLPYGASALAAASLYVDESATVYYGSGGCGLFKFDLVGESGAVGMRWLR
jgi:hypothetical protein